MSGAGEVVVCGTGTTVGTLSMMVLCGLGVGDKVTVGDGAGTGSLFR